MDVKISCKEHIYNLVCAASRSEKGKAIFTPDVLARSSEYSGDEVRTALSKLDSEGRITHGETDNDFWFKPKEKQQ